MDFPGENTLRLSREAVQQAIEGALNAQRRDGEDYIHVTRIDVPYSSYGTWDVSITTDPAKAAEGGAA